MGPTLHTSLQRHHLAHLSLPARLVRAAAQQGRTRPLPAQAGQRVFGSRFPQPAAAADASLRGQATVLEAEVVPSQQAAEEAPRWQKLLQAFVKGSAACALAAVLMLAAVNPALAARSGGRMGGGGGFGAAGGGMSRSLGGGMSSGMSRSLGGSLGGMPTSSFSRSPLLGASRPLVGSGTALGWGLSPFGGYGYGYGYPSTTVVTSGGGGGLGLWFGVGLAAVLVYAIYTNFFAGRSEEGDYADDSYAAASERVSVVKLQVGLIGSARTLQRRLERIADRADTDSTEGLHYILQETVLELMRNPEYAVYGEGAVTSAGSLDKGEAAFNEASLRERGKVKEETLVNVGGRRRASRMSRPGGNGIQELIVITILAAVKGRVAIPRVTNREELTTALAKLGGVGAEQTLAVEVLWTPQDEDDSYNRDELMMDFPTLHTL